MGEVIRIPGPDLFGNCPKCGGNDALLDVGQDRWCVCHKHKLKWWVGSDFLYEREVKSVATWKENAKILACYKRVKPLYRFPQKR